MKHETERLLLNILFGHMDNRESFQAKFDDFSFHDSGGKFAPFKQELHALIRRGRCLTVSSRDVDGKAKHIIAKISPNKTPDPLVRLPSRYDIYLFADYAYVNPHRFLASIDRLMPVRALEEEMYYAIMNNERETVISMEQFLSTDFEFYPNA